MSSKRRKGSPSVPTATNNQSKPDLDEIRALVEGLPKEQKLQFFAQIHSTTMSYQGPLPPPEDLEQYNQTLPGAAERILSMAEKEQQIRENEVNYFFWYMRIQVHWAGIVSLGLIVVSGLATWLGNEIIAIPLGSVGLLILIAHLIYEWRSNVKNDGNNGLE